jgi:hypothetical protein
MHSQVRGCGAGSAAPNSGEARCGVRDRAGTTPPPAPCACVSSSVLDAADVASAAATASASSACIALLVLARDAIRKSTRRLRAPCGVRRASLASALFCSSCALASLAGAGASLPGRERERHIVGARNARCRPLSPIDSKSGKEREKQNYDGADAYDDIVRRSRLAYSLISILGRDSHEEYSALLKERFAS